MRLKFSHHYKKFNCDEFTTIRGVRFPQATKLVVGEEVLIITPLKKFKCVVEKIAYSKLKDIPFDILKCDGEYGEFIINERQDFYNLLNSFGNFINTDESRKSIIFLKKVKKVIK